MVRDYPVKKNIKISKEFIYETVKNVTGNAEILNDHIKSSYPGMKSMDLWTDGKKLYAETETDRDYNNPMETIKTYNELIEKLTGYTAKERKKLLSK
ncbi:DUF5611 family protein [Picrophilus oshimae]|uniref:DUF5611 domain-containing protein n=1 Tax=Picrophilus torridus (strain ATCC 700027 / DSM 9790 / JCM 10055 / NBRC 100828 / KAW 2/3) TaxID=1122961 RepID=A0A8G2L7N3_PICTO|nr:DUF5611 family protein [Picrophilus oshimae]SMD30494.1 hypothetical protein SAMN02745355_0378 [Picrophilus oshimae DSM 9789]